MSASARSVVERYNLELWNQQRFELSDELLGDEIVRNGVDGQVTHTRAEARRRAEELWSRVAHIEFTLLHTICEGDLVTIVFQAEISKRDGGSSAFAGIEVFRVLDGKIVEVWNHTRQPGRWPAAA
jgi:predicted SnoaL-like aldol condensation-catalyzing enzyme